jgi:hypothetical protein
MYRKDDETEEVKNIQKGDLGFMNASTEIKIIEPLEIPTIATDEEVAKLNQELMAMFDED